MPQSDLLPFTDNKNPKVSVCIASYNHEHFIKETLDSILAQTFCDFEVIVVDDGSKDKSLEILNNYAKTHSQVKVFTHPNNENRGVSITANSAIEKSKGEYIVFIGSDDVWYPNFLEEQIKILNTDSTVGMTYSLAHYIDGDSNLKPGVFGKDVTKGESTVKMLILGNHIPALTAVVRRECLDKVGFYDETVTYSDWELWIRIASHYTVKFNPIITAKYRIHGDNMSVGIDAVKDSEYASQAIFALKRKAKQIGGEFSKYENLLHTYHGEWIADHCLNRFFEYASRGEFKQGYSHLKKGVAFYPRMFLRPRRIAAIIKQSLNGTLSNLHQRKKKLFR